MECRDPLRHNLVDRPYFAPIYLVQHLCMSQPRVLQCLRLMCPAYSGRQLAAGTAILQTNPTYAPYANQIYGTGQDPFNLTLGGYYVSAGQVGAPTATTAYGDRCFHVTFRVGNISLGQVTMRARVRSWLRWLPHYPCPADSSHVHITIQKKAAKLTLWDS